MTAQEIIDYAISSELKQLSLKNDNTTIISFINLGLIELYKRFEIEYSEALISTITVKTTYLLDGTDTDVQLGSTNGVITIVKAIDYQGMELPINEDNAIWGVYTPSYDSVQIPATYDGDWLNIIFKTLPKRVINTTDEVRLPVQLLEPLLLYIGWKGHQSINGSINQENNAYYMRFKSSCDNATYNGVITPDSYRTIDIEYKGFI